MNRPLIFLAAMASAALAVTGACLAEVSGSDRPFRADDIHFTLTDAARGDLSFRLSTRGERGGATEQASPAKLGVAPTVLDRDGPMTLSKVRQAGRIDCAGDVRHRVASGKCRFTANVDFNRHLAARGFGRPTVEDSYVMTMVDVSLDLVDAISTSSYGRPTVDDLVALAAVGVTPAYIADMERRPYRPQTTSDLVAFKAVGVTPAYVEGLAKAGVRDLDSDDIMSMRALDVTPEFIAGFARIGYANLPAGKLIELKALDVTPALVRALTGASSRGSLAQREAAMSLVARREK